MGLVRGGRVVARLRAGLIASRSGYLGTNLGSVLSLKLLACLGHDDDGLL